MSKRKNISYLFCVLLLSLTGCEDDTSPTLPSATEGESVEILLHAAMSQVTTTVTRSDFIDGTAFNDSASIGIFGLKEEGGSFTDSPYIDNRLYYNHQGSLTGEGKIYFPAGRDTAYLYAYSPYMADDQLTGEGNELRIRIKGGLSATTDSLWKEASTDPLRATAIPVTERAAIDSEELTPSVTVNMAFSHQLAQLQTTLTATSEEYLLQELIITFRNHQHGYLNLRDGSITSANESEETCTETFADVVFTDGQLSAHSALPATDAISKIEVKARLTSSEDGVVYEAYNAESATNKINLIAGHITKVNISFNPTLKGEAVLNDWIVEDEGAVNITN